MSWPVYRQQKAEKRVLSFYGKHMNTNILAWGSFLNYTADSGTGEGGDERKTDSKYEVSHKNICYDAVYNNALRRRSHAWHPSGKCQIVQYHVSKACVSKCTNYPSLMLYHFPHCHPLCSLGGCAKPNLP